MDRLRSYIAAVVLVFVTAGSLCAMECQFWPCHDHAKVATADPSPPCHQHSQQKKQEAPSQNCAHPQFVAEHQSFLPNLPDVQKAPMADVLLVIVPVAPAERSTLATPDQFWPPPTPAVRLSTVLRI
jgi:hypothetical protein